MIGAHVVKFDPFATDEGRLNDLLHATEMMLGDRYTCRSELINSLEELAVHLDAHFDHEEQEGGFFEAIVEQSPALELRAATLIDQHERLVSALDRILAYAQRRSYTSRYVQELRDEFSEFQRSLQRHEHEESELVQRAFHYDVED